ncbi:helix-turn-helix domain-containing protein [Chloroflexi bacterium TSY]|nr:helix-turn-helix domain-containing protein [Chloroflexi bacterium TSY]MBV7331916.1 helix-turn-helix domain-containing protein [Chloroflexi bacterium TSY]
MIKPNDKQSNTTTPQQRHQLFRLWEETGNANEACRRTGVSRATFYYWKPRFHSGGYDALNEMRSHAPKNPRKIPDELVRQIIALKRQHPTWGKLRIARTISKKNKLETVMSPNTVRRVLMDEGLWDVA